MGEAKRRGTKEQRMAQAIERKRREPVNQVRKIKLANGLVLTTTLPILLKKP